MASSRTVYTRGRLSNGAPPFYILVAHGCFSYCISVINSSAFSQITSFGISLYGFFICEEHRDCVGRNPTDRGRRATKLSAIVDSSGIPISLVAFPANTSDYKTVDATLLQRLCPTPRPCPLYADKGYDSKKVRHDLSHAGYIARVSQRRVSVHRVVNQRRGVVERFFSWLDKNRRLIVRYDAYIASYMSWTWLACCKILGKRM